MSGTATYPMKIAALILQAAEAGFPIICPECGKPIMPGQRVAFDHRQAKGRGGANTVANLRCVHAEREGEFACHDVKTTGGKAKATTRGSDNYEAKKTDRLVREGAGIVNKRRPNEARPKSSFGNRGSARGHRPMLGSKASGWRKTFNGKAQKRDV